MVREIDGSQCHVVLNQDCFSGSFRFKQRSTILGTFLSTGLAFVAPQLAMQKSPYQISPVLSATSLFFAQGSHCTLKSSICRLPLISGLANFVKVVELSRAYRLSISAARIITGNLETGLDCPKKMQSYLLASETVGIRDYGLKELRTSRRISFLRVDV